MAETDTKTPAEEEMSEEAAAKAPPPDAPSTTEAPEGENAAEAKEEKAEEGKEVKEKEEKIKSTVRQRKRQQKASTQRFLPIAEIRNDTVLLKNGGLRAILLVESLNFNLKSETEQKGIIAGYQGFINTLNFPLQICIRSTRLNIDPYIEQLYAQAATHTNPLLKEQTLTYAAFILRLIEIADIMQKRFYVVVPLDDKPQKQSALSQFFAWMGIEDTAAKMTARQKAFQRKSVKLRDRINLVESGLNNVGLQTRRLTTGELIELYYQIYNPKTSMEQKLPSDLHTQRSVL